MILVTGASGQLATEILTHLAAQGAKAAGASRTPRPGDRPMDFDAPQDLDLRGVRTLVLVSAGYAENDVVIARHRAVLEVAQRDGVEHVIYTSVVGQGDHLGFALAHRATERMLLDSGMEWTILRNGLYAELIGDLLTWHDGALDSPFGSGAVAAPTRDDLARAAAVVAAGPERHRGSVYELTGPPFTAADIGQALAACVSELTMGEYRERLMGVPGLLPFQPPMLVSIATSIRHGFLSRYHADLGELLAGAPAAGLKVAACRAAAARPA